MSNLNVIRDIITYFGSYVWMVLSLAVVVYTAVKSSKPVRMRIIISILGALVLILNEISYGIIIHFVDAASYYRFMWAFPYVLVVTYGLVRIILESIKKGKWYIGVIAMAAVMAVLGITGGTIPGKYPGSAIENKYQVSDDVLQIKYIMDGERAANNYGEELVIAYPRLVAIEYLTVDGLSSTPTSRNTYYFGFDTNQKSLIDEEDYLIACICENSEKTDPVKAKEIICCKKLDYMVVKKNEDMEDYMDSLGTTKIGETISYLVYRVDGNCYEPVNDEGQISSIINRTGIKIRDINISLSQQEGTEEIASYIVLNDAHTNFADVNETSDTYDTVKGRYDWARSDTGMHSLDVWQNTAAIMDSFDTDGVIMAGDMVDYASITNYELFREGFNKFTTPVMYVRADHDRGVWYNNISDAKAKELQSTISNDESIMSIETDDYIILGWNDNTGNLSEEGLNEAKAVFAKAKESGKKIILICHVPLESLIDDGLMKASMEFDEKNRVRLWGQHGMYAANDISQEFLDMITAEDSPVISVLCGHLHFEYTTKITDDITEYVLAPMFQGNIARVHICR